MFYFILGQQDVIQDQQFCFYEHLDLYTQYHKVFNKLTAGGLTTEVYLV